MANNSNKNSSRWKIIITIIIAASLQLGGFLWYSGRLSARVDALDEFKAENKDVAAQCDQNEKWIERHRGTVETTIPKVEQQLEHIINAVDKLSDKVDRMGE